MKDIERFITGFRSFRKDYFGPDRTLFETLRHGQSPKTMLIGCSDSRVDPAILTNCAPGEIFIVRNVANLVPPFEKNGGLHGVSAALEYAVCNLEVEHIIVLGHSTCGGINALMSGTYGNKGESFVADWMTIAEPVRERILKELSGKKPELRLRAAEQASILLSLDNLRSFPFVDERLSAGKLSLHGWYFDLSAGDLFEYKPETRGFGKLTEKPE